jgi:transposase
MNRYDLTDFKWRVIKLLLPNKPRAVPVPMIGACQRDILGASIGKTIARAARTRTAQPPVTTALCDGGGPV